MTEYISVDQLFKCETCFHYQNGKCYSWCDSGESYRPAYDKLKKVDAVEVVRCKTADEVCSNCHLKYAEKIEQTKAEAIKEFAERLKAKEAVHFCKCGQPFVYTDLFNGEIDNLVKEMEKEL